MKRERKPYHYLEQEEVENILLMKRAGIKPPVIVSISGRSDGTVYTILKTGSWEAYREYQRNLQKEHKNKINDLVAKIECATTGQPMPGEKELTVTEKLLVEININLKDIKSMLEERK